MRTETAPVIRLADYRPPDYLIDEVHLDIALKPEATRVCATLSIRPNPQGRSQAPLVLDGDELKLASAKLDGAPLQLGSYEATPQSLTLKAPPQRPFKLDIETEINPSANTKLTGLYRSSGIYCTQCEAEGFRRITYFLDRPDILAVYTTRLEAEKTETPLLLANGNLVEKGDVAGSGRHFALWHDPHPKPCYLFALVGGKLDTLAQKFRTMTGREVDVAIHVEPGKRERARYAMDALLRSMRWDEKVFGREYDLDVFNVVAVSDFNMGAMENKGLNVFNDKYVLAAISLAMPWPSFSWSALVFGSMATRDDRLGERHGLEDDRHVLVAQRVAGGDRLEADGRGDVAGVDFLDLLTLVRVHLQQTANALGLRPWWS